MLMLMCGCLNLQWQLVSKIGAFIRKPHPAEWTPAFARKCNSSYFFNTDPTRLCMGGTKSCGLQVSITPSTVCGYLCGILFLSSRIVPLISLSCRGSPLKRQGSRLLGFIAMGKQCSRTFERGKNRAYVSDMLSAQKTGKKTLKYFS